MKIYTKPTEQDPKDKHLEDLLKEENLTLDNPTDDWFDRMLQESKEEYDETWMAEAESKMPEGMEERLLAKIQKLETEETVNSQNEAPIIEMAQKQQTEPPRIGLKRWSRIAACIAVLLAIGIGYNMQGSNNAFADTCKTPEEAQMQLERAFAMLGKNKAAIQSANETLQQATQPQEDVLSKYISFD